MNYEELVKALRCDWMPDDSCKRKCPYADSHGYCDMDKVRSSAAAAIEALQAQLPKRGKWIKHPEVKNIYGGEYIECPLCGEKYVVQYIADEKFCRNCGADMRAKMEVQE